MSRWQPLSEWIYQPVNLFVSAAALVPFILMVMVVSLHNDNIPREDSANYSTDLAIQTHIGELTLSDLVNRRERHPFLTTDLTTVVIASVTPWNVSVGRYVLLGVAFGCYTLLVGLGVYALRGRVTAFLIPAAVLFFTIGNIFIYAMYDGLSYFYPILFSLAAYLLVLAAPVRWHTLAWGMVLAFLASVSFLAGSLAWGLVLWAMIYRGYRSWMSYVGFLIGVGGAAGVALWLIGGLAGGGPTSITTENVPMLWRFLAIYLGRLFYGGGGLLLPTWIGGSGFVLFVLSGLYIVVRQQAYRVAVTWAGVAGFCLMFGVIISVGYDHGNGLYTALTTRYQTFASLFWVSYAAVMAYLFSRPPKTLGLDGYALIAVNGVFAVILASLFVPAVYALYHNGPNSVKDVDVACNVRLLYLRDAWQLDQEGCVLRNLDRIDILADYELAAFANMTPTTMLPDKAGGIPVIQSSQDSRINFQTQKWYMDGIAPTNILHVSGIVEDVYAPRLVNVVAGDDPALNETVRDFLADTAAFWYIYQLSEWKPDYYHVVDLTPQFEEDYTYTETIYETPEGVPFYQRLYVRTLTEREREEQINGQINLWGVRVLGEPVACEPLTVISYWEAETPLDIGVPYSMTLTLNNVENIAVARTDAQLSLIESNIWEVGQVYADVRNVTLPCDLAAGDYRLQAGVYDYRDGVRLPVIGGNSGGDVVMLDTLTLFED